MTNLIFFKVTFFKIAQRVLKLLGCFWKKISCQDLSKIGQSGQYTHDLNGEVDVSETVQRRSCKFGVSGGGGGLVDRVLALNSDDSSSNPTGVKSFSL